MNTTDLGDVFKLERKLDAALQGPSRLVDVAALHGQNPLTGLSALQGPNSFAGLSALQSPSPFAGLSAAESATISAADAFESLNVSDTVADMWAASNPAAGLIQNLSSDGYLQGINALTTSYWPLSQYMSTLNIAETVIDPSWKQVLMRQSWMPEAGFVSRLAEVERSRYFALRPEIMSIADQLSQTINIPLQDTFVDYMGTLFEFDFSLDLNLDLDTLTTGEHRVLVPQNHRTLAKKRLVVWLAERPVVVEIIGVLVGEAAGVGMDTMIDGAVGDLAGNMGGAGIGLALGKALVVVVRRYRDRL